jgi:uncharacterized protein YraI
MPILLIAVLLVCALGVSAQGAVVPIAIGENKTGEMSPAAPTATFVVSSASPLSVDVRVLAITAGLTPQFRVIDPSGIVVQNVSNTGAQTSVQGVLNLTTTGAYQIVVSSATGASGQFLISVQPGEPLEPPEALVPGEAVGDSVDRRSSRRAYAFTGLTNDLLLLAVRSELNVTGPLVTLRDAETGELLGSGSARLAGVTFRIPPGPLDYLLEVTHSGGGVQDFVVCLEAENGLVRCIDGGAQVVPTQAPTIIVVVPTFAPPTFPPPTPIILPTLPNFGACVIATSSVTTVNVRSGPGLNFPVVTQLPYQNMALALGRLADGTWWQVNYNGIIGWIAASVTRIGGNCAAIPVVFPTAIPVTFVPTTQPAPATATPTPTATFTPTATQNLPSPTLNYSLPPVYGSTALTSGFVPDPFTVGVTGGGPAYVGYLGGGCTGYTTSAPSFSVNYTSGAFPTLRFYFVGSGDTTMIINSPSGSYYCVDDSFGTLNPTIDFNSPSSGRYDIWIGTFAPGGSVGGTLYVTENTGNHP